VPTRARQAKERRAAYRRPLGGRSYSSAGAIRRARRRHPASLLTCLRKAKPFATVLPPTARFRRLALSLSTLLALVAGDAAAQAAPAPRQAQSTEELINWYYSAVFGTGIYQAGDRTVGVLQLPFAYTWQPRSSERWGIKLTVPVTFGFYDFDLDDLAEGDFPQSVSTVSVLPGVELDMQVLPNWNLKPFAAAGYGWEIDAEGSAALYHLGVKSQLTFPLGRGEFMLGNTLSYAGYDARGQDRQPLTRLITGLNFTFPSNGSIAGRPVDFGMHLIHYLYAQQLPFPLAEDVDNQTRQEVEVAFSFSTRSPIPLGVFGRNLFDFDRVGLAFRAGTEVTAIRLFFSLPY
jgi:hypothetical protein